MSNVPAISEPITHQRTQDDGGAATVLVRSMRMVLHPIRIAGAQRALSVALTGSGECGEDEENGEKPQTKERSKRRRTKIGVIRFGGRGDAGARRRRNAGVCGRA